ADGKQRQRHPAAGGKQLGGGGGCAADAERNDKEQQHAQEWKELRRAEIGRLPLLDVRLKDRERHRLEGISEARRAVRVDGAGRQTKSKDRPEGGDLTSPNPPGLAPRPPLPERDG